MTTTQTAVDNARRVLRIARAIGDKEAIEFAQKQLDWQLKLACCSRAAYETAAQQ